MTTAEELLYTRLSTHTGLVALCSTRIYPVIAPDKPTYPCCVYSSNGADERVQTFGGATGNYRVTIDIDVYATTYTSLKSVVAQLITALDRYETAGIDYMTAIESLDAIDIDAGVYTQSVTVEAWLS